MLLDALDCCKHLLDNEDGVCVFGCGSHVDPDTKMCGVCRDHSANRVECERCGQAWEQWGDEWERAQ